MFKFTNKRDVDRHVAQMTKNLSEVERSSRGYAISKSYAKVSEYEMSRDWLQRYLDIKTEDAQAHKFMGEILEHLNKPEQAITSYQRAYNLNPKQNDLIKNICRLFLVNDGWTSSPGKAKYWCELADTENVRDDNVLSLRLKMLNKDKKNGGKPVEEMILKEITGRPHDVGLRIRLVQFLLEEKRFNDALKYCFDLEMKFMEIFLLSVEWYNTVSSVLAQQTATDNWNYWCLLLISLDKKIYLNLKKDLSLQAIKQNNIKDVTNMIFEFDQVLKKATETLLVLAPMKEIAKEFVNHFRGQMALNIAALLFQKQKVSSNDQWRETTKKCLPFLLFAFQCATVNTEAFWLKNTTDAIRNLFIYLKKEGSFRCAQAGRTILACKSSGNEENTFNIRNHKSWTSIEDIFNQVRETCADLNWRKNSYRLLFANADQQNKISTSYLVQDSFFQEPKYDSISFSDLDRYESTAQSLYVSSLEHHVYLGLGKKDLNTYKTHTFNGLNLSTSNLVNCNPETINRIDIDSFLYCAIIQAKRRLEAEKDCYESFSNKPNEKPLILPAANMVDNLCTEEQNEWWLSAFKIYKNISGDNLAQLKATLQFGIEAVRGIDTPKIDVIILLKLGDILHARAVSAEKIEEKRNLEIRVEYVYKIAMRMLKSRESDNLRRIFKFTTSNFDVEREITQLSGTAIGHLSGIYFKREEFKEFIEDFSGVQNPWVHYFLAEAYRKLDESSKTPKKSKKLYVEKVRENLIETLALLDGDNAIEKNNPLRMQVEKDLKKMQYNLSSSFNEDLDFHNSSQNGHTDDEIFHNASATSFRGRRDASGTNYNEKFNEVETLLKKLSELVVSTKDDVLCARNDISELKDEVLNIRGDIADMNVNSETLTTKSLNGVYKAIEELSWNVTYLLNLGPNAAAGPAARYPTNPMQAQLSQMYNTAYPMTSYNPAMQYPTPSMMQRPPPAAIGQTPPHLQYDQMNPMLNPNVVANLAMQTNAQKSSLMEALNTPTLLNTWNNTYNQQAPLTPPVVQMQPQMQQVPVAAPAPAPAPIQNKPVEKTPPVNVVITNSDPLPAQNSFVSQPTLSVTIPPQHIKHAPPPAQAFESPAVTTVTTAQPTISFGGLSGSLTQSTSLFSTTKDIKTPTKDSKDKADKSKAPAAPSPFANFSFGQTANKSFSELFGNISSGKLEESPIASGTSQAQSTPVDSNLNKSIHEEDKVEHYEPTAHFEPVIPLPDLVDAKTGEEDEDVKFIHRAKLLRYDDVTKEWKERGLGDMKVLVHKKDPSKARMLMRREHIFKLCCNMVITADLKFVKLNGNTYSFYGQDFSENEMRTEKLAIRLKTPELVESFINAVIDVQKNLGTPKVENKKTEKKDEAPKGFGDLFKPKVGSWACEACYTNNKPESIYCAACESPKDSTVPKKEAKSILAPAAGAPKFSFGMPAATIPTTVPVIEKKSLNDQSKKKDDTQKGFGDQFKPKVGSWACEACYINNKPEAIYCVACDSPKDSTVPKKEAKSILAPADNTSKFSFGMPNASGFSFGAPAATVAAQSNSFSFGAASVAPITGQPSFSFNSLAPVEVAKEAFADSTTPASGFSFDGSKSFSFGLNSSVVEKTPAVALEVPTSSDKPGFNFVFKAKSPSKKSPGKARNDSVNSEHAEEEDVYQEEENQTYFTPVIPLPDKIEVKTGEEDEEVLYSHRAKLFRFVDKEWKERGIGDIKILKNRGTGKLRVVMRREQIFKICLNFTLTSDIELKSKGDNSRTFSVVDFSEGELEPNAFAIRFKAADIAADFERAWRNALSDSNEVDDESAKLVERLKLPKDFFDYTKAAACTGCVGCDPDNFVFSWNKASEVSSGSKSIPLEPPSLKARAKPRRESIDKHVSFNLADSSQRDSVTQLQGTGNVKEKASVFGGGIMKSDASTNIFAAFNSENPTTPSNTINFSKPSNSIFSTSHNTTPVSNAEVSFGKPAEPFSTGLFGNKTTFSFSSGGDNIFNGTKQNGEEAKPLFGAFGTSTAFGSNSIFGNAAKPATPAEPATGNIFGSGLTSTFSFTEAAKSLDSNKSQELAVPDFIQNTNDSGGFAAIAANASPDKGWSGNAASAGGFFGLTVKDDFFSKNLNKSNNDEQTDNHVNDDNYDPHYEPIISLPDEINVSTGEEEEEKLFAERAKLFRYDANTREWKERGVGELKILHHPKHGSYRLLLRREQIFKLVLNQLITADLHMVPMNSSTKAFSWLGVNCAEDMAGVPEQLAVRFKNEDLAKAFKTKFDESCLKVASREELNPEND